MPKVKFSFLARLKLALLALISPEHLVDAITAGFLPAVDSLDDDELITFVKDVSNEN